MTHASRLHRPKSTSGLRTATLLALIFIAIQSTSANAQWTPPDGSNNISNTNSGNVGIGTTNPSTAVHISKPFTPGYGQLVLQDPSVNDASLTSYLSFYGSTSRRGVFGFGRFAAPSDPTLYLANEQTNGGFKFRNSSTDLVTILNSGNVGIGTTSPSHPLDVNANAQWAARFRKTDATHGGIIVESSSGYNPNVALFVNGVPKWYLNSNSSGGDALQFWESSGAHPRLTLTQTGNVGLGTTSPVFDNNHAKYLTIDSGSVEGGGSSVGSFGAGGNVGANAALGQYAFVNTGLGATDKRVATIVGLTNGGNNTGRIEFYVANAGSFVAPTMSVTSNGIGIGTTTNPNEKLEVSGNIKLTGTGNIDAAGTITGTNIVAKYQDVAEWVPSTHALPAGTVVTLDPTKSNHVEASSQAYDTRVAGVISTQPGIVLGEKGENKVLVATTGRVRVKVDATRSPIRIGDLLVTGDTSGVAMKSQPITIGGRQMHSPGTLIGKALEPLEKGRGEILVLLSLQ